MHARTAALPLALALGCAGGNDNAGSFGGSASTPTMPPVTSVGTTTDAGTTQPASTSGVPTTGQGDTTTAPDPSTSLPDPGTTLPDPSTTATPETTAPDPSTTNDSTSGEPDSTSLPDPSTTNDSTTGGEVCNFFCEGCSCPSTQCSMCCAMKDKADVCQNGSCFCF